MCAIIADYNITANNNNNKIKLFSFFCFFLFFCLRNLLYFFIC